MYRNETEVGEGIQRSRLTRSEVFITGKVNNTDQGYDSTLRAFEISIGKLKTEYLDLYLVHWPIRGKREETWKAMEKIKASGRAHAIGVANYLVPFLDELNTYASITPGVNQVELSPFLFLEDLLKYCEKKQIQLQGYSPLVQRKKNTDPLLMELAVKYNKTPAQIILKWDIELGVSAIPKSSDPDHLLANFTIFDFDLSVTDRAVMKSFHENYRVVDDPMRFL